MNRDFKHKAVHLRYIIAGLLLLIFASYYANTTLFTHYHIVDGVTIVHSHIHSKGHTSSKAPAHTRSELTLIQALSNFASELQDSITFKTSILFVIVWSYTIISYRIPISHVCIHKQLRAPPAEHPIG